MTATGETTMREMPIVFSSDDVRATLDGRKTQFRRPLSARSCLVDGASMSAKRWDAKRWDWGSAWVDDGPSPAGNPGPYLHVISLAHWTTHRIYPRVRPGDRLWVKCEHEADAFTVEVTGFRVERLQDISEADCAKESAPFTYSGFAPEDAPDWRGWYRERWESTNGPGSWDANAWVQVVEFAMVPA